jgi:hypothetical protein
VYREIDRAVLRMGEIIDAEYARLSRRKFEAWVREELPFDVYTARRMRAVFLAYRVLPSGMLEELPLPWEALFVSPSPTG